MSDWRNKRDLFDDEPPTLRKPTAEEDRALAARQRAEHDAIDANEVRDDLGPGISVALEYFCSPTALKHLEATGKLPADPFTSRAIFTVTAIANGATVEHVAPLEIFDLLERDERTRYGLSTRGLAREDVVEVLFELQRLGFPLAPRQTESLLERRAKRWIDNAAKASWKPGRR